MNKKSAKELISEFENTSCDNDQEVSNSLVIKAIHAAGPVRVYDPMYSAVQNNEVKNNE